MAFIPTQGDNKVESLINQIFSKEQLKMLYYHACRVDIDDNNDKAEMISELLGPEFQELGTGTNRIAFLYNPSPSRRFKGGAGLVYEIALDRRGLNKASWYISYRIMRTIYQLISNVNHMIKNV